MAALRYFGDTLIPGAREPKLRAMQMLKWRLQDAAMMLALVARDTGLVPGCLISYKALRESYRGDMMRGIAALFSDFLGRLRDAVGAAMTDQPEDFVVFKMVLGAEAEVEVGAATSEGRYDQPDAQKVIQSETEFLYSFAAKILEFSMYDAKMPRGILLATTAARRYLKLAEDGWMSRAAIAMNGLCEVFDVDFAAEFIKGLRLALAAFKPALDQFDAAIRTLKSGQGPIDLAPCGEAWYEQKE